MNQVPHGFAIGGVLMPPLLVAAFLGCIAAILTARLLNCYQLSKYFFCPPMVFLALTIIYTVLIENIIFWSIA